MAISLFERSFAKTILSFQLLVATNADRTPRLIDSDEPLVLDEVKAEVVHASQVAAEHQRGREHAPERELSLIVNVRAADRADISSAVHTDSEHINVVETAGAE